MCLKCDAGVCSSIYAAAVELDKTFMPLSAAVVLVAHFGSFVLFPAPKRILYCVGR